MSELHGVVFPETTQTDERTRVRITSRSMVTLAEDDAISVVIREHGVRRRETAARIIGLNLKYAWNPERGQWVFDPYDSKVDVQRQTLNGWGKPIVRVVRDYSDEVQQVIDACRPKQSPELAWHG